jgi:hypothetical protein
VQPVEEMAVKIPVAAATGGGGALAAVGGRRPLALILPWTWCWYVRGFPPSLAATKQEDFCHNGWVPAKQGFLLNIKGGVQSWAWD